MLQNEARKQVNVKAGLVSVKDVPQCLIKCRRPRGLTNQPNVVNVHTVAINRVLLNMSPVARENVFHVGKRIKVLGFKGILDMDRVWF